jgi:Domain of unknown function (DUF5615)
MTAIRFFTDEDVYGAIAPALRRAGFDAISTPEAGRLCESDESQLHWSAVQGYSLVTFNVGHFASRHNDWLRAGSHHAGIVVSQQPPIGEILRRLVHLATTLDAETMHNRLEFLGDW